MREMRHSIGEIQQSLLVSPPFPLATGVKAIHSQGWVRWEQSPSPGFVVIWRDYPFPLHEGLFVTSFCLSLTVFPVLRFPVSHVNSVILVLAARSARHEGQACLHVKVWKKTVLFSLALVYFVGSLPDPHHSLSASTPLLVCKLKHSSC